LGSPISSDEDDLPQVPDKKRTSVSSASSGMITSPEKQAESISSASSGDMRNSSKNGAPHQPNKTRLPPPREERNTRNEQEQLSHRHRNYRRRTPSPHTPSESPTFDSGSKHVLSSNAVNKRLKARNYDEEEQEYNSYREHRDRESKKKKKRRRRDSESPDG